MKYKKEIVFKCPYCSIVTDREALVKHIEKQHSDMIPEGYTAARVVFNYINRKDGGLCVICSKPTTWNEKIWKYNRICSNPACKQRLSDMADENMKRVYNTTTLLNDPKHQEKMLSSRSISGTYKFKDGGSFGYVGSYERKCLEFMDIVLDIHSVDVMTPGPVIEYLFEDKMHIYISDIYYIPANLIIEVKDGGSNPNNRSMVNYRAKQTAKEKEIARLGNYNYIRLTNNNFEQLFEILSEIKYSMMIENDKPIIRIHEEVGGMPRQGSTDAIYVVQYGNKSSSFSGDSNNVEGYGITKDPTSKYFITRDDKDSKLKLHDMKSFLGDRKFSIFETIIYNRIGYIHLLSECKREATVDPNHIIDSLYNMCPIIEDSIRFDIRFKPIDLVKMSNTKAIIEATFDINNDKSTSLLVSNAGKSMSIKRDALGYYAAANKSMYRTPYFDSVKSLHESNMISSLLAVITKEEK